MTIYKKCDTIIVSSIMEVFSLNKKLYATSLKKTPYKYSIAKKIAKLMLKKMDRAEIYAECYEKNYIEIDSEQRRREVTNVIYERLLSLDDFLLNQFYEGDVETSKFILVYAIAKTDILFFEFMFEVYREALVGNKSYISLDDFDNFFASKKENEEDVAKWGNYTIDQLAKGYRTVLADSGLGIREKRNIKAIRVMIHPAVEEHIKMSGDGEYLKALLGA